MQNDNKPPYLVIWETTQTGAKAPRNGQANIHRHPLELDTTEARAMIDQIARMRPESFLLAGGDPMARSDMAELIAYAASQGLRVTLSSSATPRLAGADFQALKRAGLHQISLGLDRVPQTTLPGAEREGDYTMAVVRKAHEAGLPVQVHTTFTRLNFVQFDALVAQIEEIQPRRWSVFQGVPCAVDGLESLTAEEGEELSRKLARLAQQVPFEIKTTESPVHELNKLSPASPAPGSRPAVGLVEGRGFLFISHVGGLRPSSFHPITAGNVRVCDFCATFIAVAKSSNGITPLRFHPADRLKFAAT